MTIPITTREAYQPNIDPEGNFIGGQRDCLGRLKIIEEHVDFTGKRVLDLGCSGGFFSLSICRKAESVLAIDADPYMIERNTRIADELGLNNVKFQCNTITPKFLGTLSKHDVVLFMSVFHHMLVASHAYEWTESINRLEAHSIIDAVKLLGDVLIFEVGRPDEGYPWCKHLAELVGEPRDWVPKHVFENSYDELTVCRGSAFRHWPFSFFPFALKLFPGNRYGNRLLRMLGTDRRDFREIYIGKNRVS